MAIPSVVFTWTIADPADKSRPAALEASGWTSVVNKPSRQHMNWMFENIAQWITYFNAEAIPDAAAAYLPDFLEQHNSDGTHSTVTTSGSLTVGTNAEVTGTFEVGGAAIINGQLATNSDANIGGTLDIIGDLTISQSSGIASITMGGADTTITGSFYETYVLPAVYIADFLGHVVYARSTTPFAFGATIPTMSINNTLPPVNTDPRLFSARTTSMIVPTYIAFAGSKTVFYHVDTAFNSDVADTADLIIGPPDYYEAEIAGRLAYVEYSCESLNRRLDRNSASTTKWVFPYRVGSGSSLSTQPDVSFFRGCRLEIGYRNLAVALPTTVIDTTITRGAGSGSAYLSKDATDNTIGYITINHSDLPNIIKPITSIYLMIKFQIGDEIAKNDIQNNYVIFYPMLIQDIESQGFGRDSDFEI